MWEIHKNYKRSLCTKISNLSKRWCAHMEKIRATQHFKWIVATFVLTPIGAEGDYEIITVMQYVMQLILYTHVLILHHYIYIYIFFFLFFNWSLRLVSEHFIRNSNFLSPSSLHLMNRMHSVIQLTQFLRVGNTLYSFFPSSR